MNRGLYTLETHPSRISESEAKACTTADADARG